MISTGYTRPTMNSTNHNKDKLNSFRNKIAMSIMKETTQARFNNAQSADNANNSVMLARAEKFAAIEIKEDRSNEAAFDEMFVKSYVLGHLVAFHGVFLGKALWGEYVLQRQKKLVRT